jgi:very-short-patch-repair endonuclease
MPILNNTVERTMFYGAKPIIFERAKTMRQNPTIAEKTLWEQLRNNQILGLRFKHQHPIDIFIADFYCHKIKLVIEVDGDVHNSEENKEYDQNRTAELENFGITVIRFKNEDVLDTINETKTKIETICKQLLNA